MCLNLRLNAPYIFESLQLSYARLYLSPVTFMGQQLRQLRSTTNAEKRQTGPASTILLCCEQRPACCKWLKCVLLACVSQGTSEVDVHH